MNVQIASAGPLRWGQGEAGGDEGTGLIRLGSAEYRELNMEVLTWMVLTGLKEGVPD